ncbi:MAG: (2Fe-2S)-binding protein [Bacteriovoracaceae bacterium]|nr:(2Fe-2S)-binding protein [Bacteriovoracaceae bacterium]
MSVSILNSRTNKPSSKENLAFELDESEIIYDGLDRQGLKLPAGCLAGSCGTCKINVISGIENCSSISSVEQDTIDHISADYKEKHGDNCLDNKNLRLACRAKVKGPISIETFKI